MKDDDELRARLKRALSRLPDREGPPIEDISARSRGHAVRRRLGTGIVAACLVLAVGAPLFVISRVGKGRIGATATSPGAGSLAAALPDVASVVCDPSGTTVLTPDVRPQPDGVHFRVDNRTGEHLGFEVDGSGGRNAPPGAHELEDGAWVLAPGAIQVRCFDARQHHPWISSGWASMTIRDPQGLWVPDQVTCEYSSMQISDFVSGAKGEQGDPVDVARRAMSGFLEEGDQVLLAGYPEAVSPEVAVVRDGAVVATLKLLSDGQDGWLVSERAECTGPPPPLQVVDVTCNERGTHVPDQAILRQSDGVHFKVDNPMDGPVTLEIEGYGSASSPYGNHDLIDPATGTLAWPIPAGTIRVRCSGAGVPVSTKDDGWHEVVISEPGG